MTVDSYVALMLNLRIILSDMSVSGKCFKRRVFNIFNMAGREFNFAENDPAMEIEGQG